MYTSKLSSSSLITYQCCGSGLDPESVGDPWIRKRAIMALKIENSFKISCFEVLDVMLAEASPVAWPSFRKAWEQVNRNF
jgi:hypothetical protein